MPIFNGDTQQNDALHKENQTKHSHNEHNESPTTHYIMTLYRMYQLRPTHYDYSLCHGVCHTSGNKKLSVK